MADIADRLRAVADATGPNEAREIVIAAADEIERLRRALHAAIAAPLGVVPDSAVEFYDPDHPALWRLNKRQG